MRATLRTTTPDATAALGAALAPLLEPGDVVSLAGPLGAGKTRFVQGLAAGLGVDGRVTSPTFVLARRHRGRLPLLHCDAYRLERTGDLATLDDDVLAPDVVTCVEWGDAVADALPASRLDVMLTPQVAALAPGGTDAGDVLDAAGASDPVGAAPRDVVLAAHGPAWERRWPAVLTAVAEVGA